MKSLQIWIRLAVIFLIQIEMIAMKATWYESSDGKRYLIQVEQIFDWFEAWNVCAGYDAQLVTIESEDKDRDLMKLLKTLNDFDDYFWYDEEKHRGLMKVLKNLNENDINLWTGGNFFYEKTSFQWADSKQEFNPTNWFLDKVQILSSSKQCLYISKHNKHFPWNVVNCEAKKFGFICEEREIKNTENISETESVLVSMYNGSIYRLIEQLNNARTKL